MLHPHDITLRFRHAWNNQDIELMSNPPLSTIPIKLDPYTTFILDNGNEVPFSEELNIAFLHNEKHTKNWRKRFYL